MYNQSIIYQLHDIIAICNRNRCPISLVSTYQIFRRARRKAIFIQNAYDSKWKSSGKFKL